MTRYQRFLAAVVCAAIVLLLPWQARSHTPYRPKVVFFDADRPVSRFAAGRIGVVRAEWSWSYLVVAYRYFIGQPLTAGERKSFLAQRELLPKSALPPAWENNDSNHDDSPGSPWEWVKARAKFRDTKPPTNVPGSDWWKVTGGEACRTGAFETAIKTLHDRARRFGAGSAQLREWIDGQDQVFLNCPRWVERPEREVVPAALPDNAGSLLRADRAYQIAAAHFYARNYDSALREFDAIAHDNSSPWHELAGYLTGRTLVRKATMDDPGERPDLGILRQAEERLRAFAGRTQDQELRHSALGLLNFIALRLRPQQQLRAVSVRLTYHDASFGQDVIDFNYLLDSRIGEEPDFPGVEDGSTEYDRRLAAWRQERYHAVGAGISGSEIADWVLTMASWSAWSQKHSMDRWRAGRSLPWLVAAIIKTNGRAPEAMELLAAAAQIPRQSPAYVTLALHRGRLLRERGAQEQARRAMANSNGMTIASLVLANEKCWRTQAEIHNQIRRIWQVMQACVQRGLHATGTLPGGLNVQRRASGLYSHLLKADSEDSLDVMDWINVYALATNEENAAGGQVVTAPANGAAGIIPAVLHYYQKFCKGASEDGIFSFFLTAGAIGILYKENASISGAEVGCQGEVGVACSMAAAGLVAALGGTNEQMEHAAEIGMEHHLGMTCDPVGGLVQIPCIERNALGAMKAINSARMATRGDGLHQVSLDQVIKTMYQTGLDMQARYKETSQGGLAIHVVEC